MLSFILIDKAKYELAITITKYFFVSVLSFGLNVVINVICYELFNFSPVIVYPFSVLSISAMNFLLCRYFIFKNSTSKKLFTQGYQFILSTVLFRLAESVFLLLLFKILDIWYVVGIIFTQSLWAIMKFFFYRAFVFRSPSA